jgi:hypothetical protein
VADRSAGELPPWERPPKPAPKPVKGKSRSKPMSQAARKAIQERHQRDETCVLECCPRCGALVLQGRAEGRSVALDIWEVPHVDALVMYRYGACLLWREHGRGKFMVWASWNRGPALMEHRCGNRWWLVPIIAEDECA